MQTGMKGLKSLSQLGRIIRKAFGCNHGMHSVLNMVTNIHRLILLLPHAWILMDGQVLEITYCGDTKMPSTLRGNDLTPEDQSMVKPEFLEVIPSHDGTVQRILLLRFYQWERFDAYYIVKGSRE